VDLMKLVELGGGVAAAFVAAVMVLIVYEDLR
jgi:hypothetical protein